MKALLQLQLGVAALIIILFAFRAPASAQSPALPPAPDQTPLTAQQVHQLISCTIANQHRNDAAADSFERIERQVARAGSADGPISQDKTYRVVPTGSGTIKLLVRDSSKSVSESLYRRQLRDWEKILQQAVHPDDPLQIAVLTKQQKKQKDRARFIDGALSAYKIFWLAREVRDGRIVEKLLFQPNPNYRPRGDATDWLTHAEATIWIDAQEAQAVAIDATIVRDISIGGGILGKVYRGGHFLMRQAPAAPGIWEPSQYEYDISGRKFLFGFAMHQEVIDSHYQLLGPPAELLARAQDNLAHCCDLKALTMATTLHTGAESH